MWNCFVHCFISLYILTGSLSLHNYFDHKHNYHGYWLQGITCIALHVLTWLVVLCGSSSGSCSYSVLIWNLFQQKHLSLHFFQPMYIVAKEKVKMIEMHWHMRGRVRWNHLVSTDWVTELCVWLWQLRHKSNGFGWIVFLLRDGKYACLSCNTAMPMYWIQIS